MSVYSMSSKKQATTEAVVAPCHVLETLIESATNEMNMFNAVLGIDFMEVYTEADETTDSEDKEAAKAKVSESGKQGIIKKIGEVIAAAGKKIMDFLSTFAAKLENLVLNDEKIYTAERKNKFAERVKTVKIDKFDSLKKDFKDIEDFEAFFTEIMDSYSSAAGTVAGSKVKEDIDDAVSEFSAKKVDADKIRSKFFGEEKTDSLLSEDDKAAVDYIADHGKDFVKNIKEYGKNDIKAMKIIKKDSNHDWPDDDKLAMVKLNATYTLISKTCALLSQTTSAYVNNASKYVATARKLFLKVVGGKDPEKEAEKVEKVNPDASAEEKEGAKNEAVAYNYLLGEASDFYVESVLEMA